MDYAYGESDYQLVEELYAACDRNSAFSCYCKVWTKVAGSVAFILAEVRETLAKRSEVAGRLERNAGPID